MDNVELIKDTGEVTTEKIDLISRGKRYDIKTMAMQTVIYEDIFSNVMTGYLVMQDAASFITQLPLTGLETLEVSFKSPGFRSERIERKFYITSVDARVLAEKEQIYVMNFISTEGLKDNITRISKKFKGVTHTVIEKVFNEYLKEDKKLEILEQHTSNVALVSPYWSPLKVINWVATRSYKKAPNVLFFEGNKNFYLTSIEQLAQSQKNSVFGTYSYIPTSNTGPYKDLASRYNNIIKINPIPFMDVFRAQDFGYYASKLITHDITLKQYKEFSLDHYEQHKKYFNLHDATTFPKDIPRSPDSYRAVKTKQYKLFDEYVDPLYESWAMQRNSLMFEANNFRFAIQIPGRTDIEVGKVIECLIPKALAKNEEGKTIEDFIDPYLSGRYLITAIRHQFTLNKHEMYMEIMKESFKKSVD